MPLGLPGRPSPYWDQGNREGEPFVKSASSGGPIRRQPGWHGAVATGHRGPGRGRRCDEIVNACRAMGIALWPIGAVSAAVARHAAPLFAKRPLAHPEMDCLEGGCPVSILGLPGGGVAVSWGGVAHSKIRHKARASPTITRDSRNPRIASRGLFRSRCSCDHIVFGSPSGADTGRWARSAGSRPTRPHTQWQPSLEQALALSTGEEVGDSVGFLRHGTQDCGGEALR
jgi:hypothetical protein